jgi:hypothetical protein
MADKPRGVHSLPAASLEAWLDSSRVSVMTLDQPIRETLEIIRSPAENTSKEHWLGAIGYSLKIMLLF